MESALEAEIAACRKRAELAEKRAAETHAARERREQARDQVADFLSEVLFGKRIPNMLLEFLLGPWQHHQNMTLLREGEGADEVIANQFLLRDLLRASDSNTIAAPEKLQAGISQVLQSSGRTEEEAKVFMGQLEAALKVGRLTAEAKAAAAPGVEVKLPPMPAAAAPVVVEKALLATSAAAIVPALPNTDAFIAPQAVDASALPQDLVAKFEAMPIGTWIDMISEDGRITPARVSFISPISGKRILSNRRGLRVLCASVQELATMETEGQLKSRYAERAFDNALGTVGKRLQATTAQPATAAA
jgi:hypothetical protein